MDGYRHFNLIVVVSQVLVGIRLLGLILVEVHSECPDCAIWVFLDGGVSYAEYA